MLYLDNAATTPVLEAALRAAWPWLTTEFGNPSSTHELGLRAKAALEDARETVLNRIFGSGNGRILFTGGATEANNLAVKGIALANPRGRHIVSSPTEHESILQAIDYLVRIHDFDVTWLPVDILGQVSIEALHEAVTAETTLVAIMWVNNETGTITDMIEIQRYCRSLGVPLHVDAVQAVTSEPIDMTDYHGITTLSLSGHKLGAPKGSGVLYVREGIDLEPLLSGGGQEYGLRSGTENVAWAVAFARAFELANSRVGRKQIAELAELSTEFIEGVLRDVPGAQLTGDPERRSPAIASFVFEGISGEAVLLGLEARGIVCSSGSACAAGRDEPSHVLLAMGLPREVAQTAVRFSFTKPIEGDAQSHRLSQDELNGVVTALSEVVVGLRRLGRSAE